MFVRTLSGFALMAASAGAAIAQPAIPQVPATTVPIPLPPAKKVDLPQPPPPRPGEIPARFIDPPNAPPVSAHPVYPGKMPVYDQNEAVGPSHHFWVRNEWLYWATSGQPLPILATGSPAFTAPGLAGVPGTVNTVTLYGDSRVNNDFRNGYRLSAGTWFDDCRTCGIEGDFFFLGDSRQGFSTGSFGTSIIGRPYVHPATGQPAVSLVSFPGRTAGALNIDVRNSTIGGGVNTIHDLCGGDCHRIDLLVGYRYWNVADDVQITDARLLVSGGVPVAAAQFHDRFQTSNNFHGGLIGLAGETQGKKWFVGGRASVALGANCQTIDIGGSTLIATPNGVPATPVGGLLAQPGNIGQYNRSVFAVVPEVGVRVGCHLSEHTRFYAAYNFLYMSSVVRAGDQIGTSMPIYTPNPTDFWAQGVSLGFELHY